MTRYIASLRGIHVAGHARAKMDDLKRTFVAAGCENVRTAIQSSNVIFDALETTQNGSAVAEVRNLLR